MNKPYFNESEYKGWLYAERKKQYLDNVLSLGVIWYGYLLEPLDPNDDEARDKAKIRFETAVRDYGKFRDNNGE